MHGETMRILLVEDDELIGDGIKVALTRQGFSVDWCENGEDGESALKIGNYDAVILDLSLPGKDGLAILASWRKGGLAVPVLILTAQGAVAERVTGLNMGADDYMGKPFSLEELVARLRALVRRSGGQPSAVLQHGDIELFQETRSVSKAGVSVSLSPREIALLELFMLNKKRILTKNALEEKLYSWDTEISSNAIEVHIHHLRRKLGSDVIRTVHRIGYILGEAP